MKSFLFKTKIEVRLLTGDFITLCKKVAWFLKKSMTPAVLLIFFWVAFQIIKGFLQL